jgi:membrane fusion protein (multidrug efflux system)
VELKMLAAGRVVEVGFEGGQPVSTGDVLLRLERDVAEAALSEARADYLEAEGVLSRTRTLREQGRVAEAALEAAEAAMARARSSVLRAENNLENRQLLAPFDGVVGFTEFEVGARVDNDTTVATIDDLSSLTVAFTVPERFFGDVVEGAQVRAESQIYPDMVFEGVVTGVGRRLDTVSRTFEVRAEIANEDALLPAGAFLRVTLVFDAREGVLLPEEAIVSQSDSSHVFVVEDGRAIQRPVQLGARRVGAVEVLSGVEAGEAVIIRGVQKVRDGLPVREAGEAPPSGRPSGPATS